jgi:JmjC domain, hydroxylase
MASRASKEWKARNYPDDDPGGRHAENEDRDRRQFTPENLEQDYWEIVETRNREMGVEYGNDVDTNEFGSGFPLSERGRGVYGTSNPEKMNLPEPKFGTEDFYKESWWNVNNIPWAPGSVLRHVKVGINGINVPWMYYGSLFTTFCWHNEDNYLYSINYHHKGAPKQWYGIPGSKKDADGLEKVFKNYLSMKMRDVPDLLHHITTMFSPRLLQSADVPVYKLLQNEGEYVITFPRAFHGGFSFGPNIGEAVNFATHDWIKYGSDVRKTWALWFIHAKVVSLTDSFCDFRQTKGTGPLPALQFSRMIV